MKKRIFIAFDIPRFIAEKLKKYHFDHPDIHWTRPENLHLTMIFLGEQDEENIEKILSNTETLANFFPPQKIEFMGVLPFKQMLWAEVIATANLYTLHNRLEQVFFEADILPGVSQRSFRPHINLARCRHAVTEQIFPVRKLANLSFNGTHLVIFESILRQDSPRYESLDAFELTGK